VHYEGAAWTVQYVTSKGLVDLQSVDGGKAYGISPTDLGDCSIPSKTLLVSSGGGGGGASGGGGSSSDGSELHTWLVMAAGLKGKKFEAARAACDHHLLESVEELMELHVEGKLSQVFDHVGVQLAIERALSNQADSNTPVPKAEVVAVSVGEDETVANTLHQYSSAAVV
jgi:hypothetical protein